MKKWLFILLGMFYFTGCSDGMIKPSEQQQVPKSYSLAIGYLNQAKWERATTQLIETVQNNEVDANYQKSALLLLIHVTNGELLAYKKVDNNLYKSLYEEREEYYEKLLEIEGSIQNDLYLGINYNLSVPENYEPLSSDEQQYFEQMTSYILEHLSGLFSMSPINIKLLIEQSRDAVQEADSKLANQLDTKATSMDE